jgi:hypothetical protein
LPAAVPVIWICVVVDCPPLGLLLPLLLPLLLAPLLLLALLPPLPPPPPPPQPATMSAPTEQLTSSSRESGQVRGRTGCERRHTNPASPKPPRAHTSNAETATSGCLKGSKAV